MSFNFLNLETNGDNTLTSPVDLRLLGLRSGLMFEYPSLKAKEQQLVFFLPFFENPEITETRQSRLVEYDVINRGSSYFTHVGAKARSFTLRFHLTMDHILNSISAVQNSQTLIQSIFTDKEKERFSPKTLTPFETENERGKRVNAVEQTIRQWQERVADKYDRFAQTDQLNPNLRGNDPVTGVPRRFDAQLAAEELNRGNGLAQQLPGDVSFNMSKEARSMMNTLIFILDIIRTAGMSNQTKTALGPPLIRLRHGAAYRDVPCILRSESINIVEEAGYDLKTLIPKRFNVTLELAEVRMGDFSKFSPGVPIKRDNMAGWESVIDGHGYDPGNGAI